MGKLASKGLFRLLSMLFLALLISGAIYSQQDDYYEEFYIRNEDYTYNENIKTVLLYKAGYELSPPIIELHSTDKLMLIFDDLEDDIKYYKYTIIHCDAYWNTSDIRTQEYIEGFTDDEIREYRRSFNTIEPYTNYKLLFPTPYMRPKKSGNYILKVFKDYDSPENVVITKRFMILDQRVVVAGRTVKTTNLEDRYTKQQINFRIITKNYPIHNPYQDIHVVIRQNGRWDNMITNISPRMVVGDELDYSLNPDIVFEAGNEYRYFDMKAIKYATDRMYTMQLTQDGYEAILLPDRVKKGRPYISDDDINGKRLIAANQVNDPHTGGEYAYVHFVFPYSRPLVAGNVYVMGELSNWQFSPENLMEYDFGLKAYSAVIFLKQGYYNYCYAFLPDGKEEAEVGLFEGSHWETENDYTIYVYHRQPGEFYDQLIGIHYLNTFQ